MKISFKLLPGALIAALFLLGSSSVVLAQPAGKTVTRLDALNGDQPGWKLVLWERAKGTLTVVKDDPAAGRTSLRFAADLSEKGVAARIVKEFKGMALNETTVFQMKMKSETATNYGVVLVDETGQTHQKKGFKIETDNTWRDVEFDPAKIAGGEHWGGANDGKWHGAPQSLAIVFNTRSDAATLKPTISISEMRAVSGVSTGPVDRPVSPAGASAPLAPNGAGEKKVVRLDVPGGGQQEWKVDLWERSTGALTVLRDEPAPGQTSLRFAADLSNKGVAARLIRDLKGLALNDTSVIQMKIKSETATSFGVVFVDETGQTHQRKGVKIQPDNTWRDIEFDPRKVAGGEHWGGANDGRWHGAPTSFVIGFNAKSDEATQKPTISISDMRVVTGVSTTPVGAAMAPVSSTVPQVPAPPALSAAEQKARSAEYQDFNPGDNTVGGEWIQSIVIKAPELRSEVKGDVKVEFAAPGMTSARVLCWQQPTAQNKEAAGHDQVVAPNIKLDAMGNGDFVFPAEQFPHGPISVRILAHNDAGQRDFRELQLWNAGGVVWNQGIPKKDPPAAAGMKLAFADDFDGPLSISRDGQNAKYYSHKPGGGDFSGWPFRDFEGPENPFSQKGTFLRIHASKPEGSAKGSSGLISSVRKDGTGFYMTAPFYAECRFTSQSAIGTWPAFWTMTKNAVMTKGSPGDELDIVEAYGGVGAGNPNHPGYSITTHFWKQTAPDGTKLKNINKRVNMSEVGNKSYWSHTFHTYAVKVTETDTSYYLDDIEVLRHPTGPISKSEPAFFMINFAIGGISGWKIDLAREGNASDMWVDYVRVYQGE